MRRRFGIRFGWQTWIVCLGLIWTGLGSLKPAAAEDAALKLARHPDILIVTVDTLRVDRVSAYGYKRPTTPHIDALMAKGVRFTQARVPEPLTAPSMVSMVTSVFPHEHGTTRNGLRMRPGLASF
ncbi:MAG: sulfatase-like hydrolase/transferase, partial [Actinomycetia bacterium]|nr:sulfatase-like hydrolase/transferase [Actinomycetes bacterium]